jgi:hypothetical protein
MNLPFLGRWHYLHNHESQIKKNCEYQNYMRKHIVQKGKTFTTTAQTKQRHTTTAAQRIVTGIQRGEGSRGMDISSSYTSMQHHLYQTFHPATHPFFLFRLNLPKQLLRT